MEALGAQAFGGPSACTDDEMSRSQGRAADLSTDYINV
jgi:hypothetical protein